MKIEDGELIRVLVLGLTDTIGGVENYLKGLTLSSNKNRVRFDFLVKKGKKGCYEDELISFYGTSTCIHHVTRLKENLIRSIRQMKKLSNDYHYDVIYVNTCTASDILYAKIFFTEVPIVMHSHYSSSNFMLSNMLFKKTARKKAIFKLACSENASEWMYGNHEAKIINNGIETNKFRYSDKKRRIIRDKYGITDEDLLIGNVGRLTEQKNQVFLIEIVKRLVAYNNYMHMYNKIFVAIIGEGIDEQKIRSRANVVGIADNLIMPGAISNTDEYYCGFDMFVMPSLYEGLPIVGIEAQCSGLPCLFSDKIDKQILITDRSKSEHLSSSNDNYQEWAYSIWDYCQEVEKYRSNRESYANIIIEKGYDIKNVADEVCKILEDSSNWRKTKI